MDSFQAIIGWKRMRNRENKNYRSVSFLPDAWYKIPKKLQKKFKNTIMDSFQAIIGSKRMRNRENKNFRSVSFLSDAWQKIPKKFKKLKDTTIVASFQAFRLEKSENEQK